jgi:hypothetical protein
MTGPIQSPKNRLMPSPSQATLLLNAPFDPDPLDPPPSWLGDPVCVALPGALVDTVEAGGGTPLYCARMMDAACSAIPYVGAMS